MKPLLICDADEVLVQFAAAFKAYLLTRELSLRFDSFALYGNIRSTTTGELTPRDMVTGLVDSFFEEAVESCQPVDGAVEALARLSTRADIIILTNVPFAQRARREVTLASQGMAYPVIANAGPKGPRVAELIAQRTAPVAFVDDIPHHHKSVASLAPQVHRLHLVAEPELRALMPPAADAHARIDEWPLALPHLENILFGP